jgi:ATP-dependent Clp protease protease subunit
MPDIDYDELVKKAEAEKYKAEAAKFRVDTKTARLNQEYTRLTYRRSRDDDEFRRAADVEHQVYRFRGVVDERSVAMCIEHLTRWSRLNPGSNMTIVLNSPGGYITEGFDLFDTILELRREGGHYMTGIGRGYVASMGSILLQAFDHRVMGPGCSMLIHEPSGMALGSLGEIEDTKAWLDMLAQRSLDIYAQRCEEARIAGTAEKPYTKTQLKAGWNRKNWWLSSEACLKGGLIDEIR